MVYGKPSLLIRSLLNKIRNLPPPRLDNIRTVIEFGLAVKALTNQMKAAKLNAHLNNPMLLEELEEKLSGEMRLNWAEFQEVKTCAVCQREGHCAYECEQFKAADKRER